MRTFIATLLTTTALLAQTPRKSPHETIEGSVGSAHLKITYGRPYLKGRAMNTLVPSGEVWRLGADEATTLTTDKDIMLGSLAVPAGTYALFAMPQGAAWTLIVNKTSDQWGLDYDKNKATDLGKTKLTMSKTAAPVEQFTMAIKGDKLQMMWGTTDAEATIKAK